MRPHADADPMKPPTVAEIGEEYVRHIVDLSPGQRKRYLAQVKEADVKVWLIGWDRSLKTKANYRDLLYGVLGYAVEQGYQVVNPCARTAPKRSRIKQSQADLWFLTEAELAAAARLAGADGYLLRVAVGTGLRFGDARHHLGNPKTPKSRRTVQLAEEVAAVLDRLVGGRAADDFVFTTPTGRSLHGADFYERVWYPLHDRLREAGPAPAHPGPAWARVDHHHHRQLRPPAAGR